LYYSFSLFTLYCTTEQFLVFFMLMTCFYIFLFFAAAPAEVPFILPHSPSVAAGLVFLLATSASAALGWAVRSGLRERAIVRRELQTMQYAVHSFLVAGSFEQRMNLAGGLCDPRSRNLLRLADEHPRDVRMIVRDELH
jgi:hypothetical protein